MKKRKGFIVFLLTLGLLVNALPANAFSIDDSTGVTSCCSHGHSIGECGRDLDSEKINAADFFSKDVNIARVVSNEECHMALLRELVFLIERRNIDQSHLDFNAADFASRTGTFAGKKTIHDNPRLNRLEELNLILVEAQTIINNFRNISRRPIVIAGFGGPWEGNNYLYEVMLLYEEYLELTDLIVEFTGIPESQLEFRVINELFFVCRGEIGQPIGRADDFTIIEFNDLKDSYYNEAYQFQPFSMPTIRVGMPIYIWHPQDL